VSITFTTDAATNVSAMIRGITEADREDANGYPILGTPAECARWTEEFTQRQIERRNNLLVALAAMFGLGGNVVAEDNGLLGRNDFLTYGVCQSRDGRWSVNS